MASEYFHVEDSVVEELRRAYTETVVDHTVNPRNAGRIPDADGFGTTTSDCGDTLEIWLKVNNDRIMNATFLTNGCGANIATGSMVTELARGKNVAEARNIGTHDILDALGGLPEGNVHCARQAAITLRLAIQDYLAIKKEPWKKTYRKF